MFDGGWLDVLAAEAFCQNDRWFVKTNWSLIVSRDKPDANFFLADQIIKSMVTIAVATSSGFKFQHFEQNSNHQKKSIFSLRHTVKLNVNKFFSGRKG